MSNNTTFSLKIQTQAAEKRGKRKAKKKDTEIKLEIFCFDEGLV